MSLQDDVWDVEAVLKEADDEEYVKAYDRIVTALWGYEKRNDELAEANATFYKTFKLIRAKCECDIAKIQSAGAKYCWKCGGFIEAAK